MNSFVSTHEISDIDFNSVLNTKLNIICVVSAVEIKQKKDGGDYLSCLLGDRATKIKATCWSMALEEKLKALTGQISVVTVKVGKYNDAISLTIDEVTEYSESTSNLEISRSRYVVEVDIESYYEKINALLAEVVDTPCWRIAYSLLSKKKDFYTRAAAKKWHHSYQSGLLAHSVNVAVEAKITATTLMDLYPDLRINTSVLICSALLHDVGKLGEITPTGEIYDEAIILPHILQSTLAVQEEAVQLGLQNEPDIKDMIHCIASHHGDREKGAMTLPASIEARIISRCDELDAFADRFNNYCAGDNSKAISEKDWQYNGYNDIFIRAVE